MNFLPGRCRHCGGRVFWTGVQWSDTNAANGVTHICSVAHGRVTPKNAPRTALTAGEQATPDRTGGNSG